MASMSSPGRGIRRQARGAPPEGACVRRPAVGRPVCRVQCAGSCVVVMPQAGTGPGLLQRRGPPMSATGHPTSRSKHRRAHVRPSNRWRRLQNRPPLADVLSRNTRPGSSWWCNLAVPNPQFQYSTSVSAMTAPHCLGCWTAGLLDLLDCSTARPGAAARPLVALHPPPPPHFWPAPKIRAHAHHRRLPWSLPTCIQPPIAADHPPAFPSLHIVLP
jgi:hypothetical protein